MDKLIPITQEAWEKVWPRLEASYTHARPEDFGLRVVDGVVVPRAPLLQDRRPARRRK